MSPDHRLDEVVAPHQLIAARTMQWHAGLLTKEPKLPPHFEMHVAGVDVGEVTDRSVRFHTYACLTPDVMYMVFNTGRYPELSIERDELHGIIADFAPTIEQLGEWLRLLHTREIPAELRWKAASLFAGLRNLPIAFMAFGQTSSGELTVRQRSILYAPLLDVYRAFAMALQA